MGLNGLENKMDYVYWTTDLETGFEDIDEQHQHLVECLNELYKAQ